MGKHQDYLNPGACLKENGHQSSITFETHSKVTAKKEERGGTGRKRGWMEMRRAWEEESYSLGKGS